LSGGSSPAQHSMPDLRIVMSLSMTLCMIKHGLCGIVDVHK